MTPMCDALRAIIVRRNAEAALLLSAYDECLPATAEAHIAHLWKVVDAAERLLAIYEHETIQGEIA